MKRTFSILLALFVIVYAKQVYDIYTTDYFLRSHTSGALSDIADEVIAIPLEAGNEQRIETAKNVRQVGNDLFLISNETLYRFTREGKFVCQITDPEEICVAGYVVNQALQELIVLGNTDDIFYFTYDGNIREKKKMKSDLPNHRLESFAMFGDKIWTVEEGAYLDEDTLDVTIQKRVVTYDTAFQVLESRVLIPANLGRNQFMIPCQSRLLVDQDSGMVYAYSPEVLPDNLLQDTAFLSTTRKKQMSDSYAQQAVSLFPLQFGNRFWISSYFNQADEQDDYLYCYDNVSKQSWQVSGGLKDNFYQTGSVLQLEAMDAFCGSFSFCKSGEEVKKAFPNRKAHDNAVVFIVKLKV